MHVLQEMGIFGYMFITSTNSFSHFFRNMKVQALWIFYKAMDYKYVLCQKFIYDSKNFLQEVMILTPT